MNAARVHPVGFIASGDAGLDEILGGGWACGRLSEVLGGTPAARQALAAQAILSCQLLCGRPRTEGDTSGIGVAAYIDVAGALDLPAMQRASVDVSRLLVGQPDTLADGMEITETLVRSGACDLVVVDLGGVEGTEGEAFSLALRGIVSVAYRTGCTILVLTGGGSVGGTVHAVKFYASTRLHIKRVDPDGRLLVATVKNKTVAPFRRVELLPGVTS